MVVQWQFIGLKKEKKKHPWTKTPSKSKNLLQSRLEDNQMKVWKRPSEQEPQSNRTFVG